MRPRITVTRVVVAALWLGLVGCDGGAPGGDGAKPTKSPSPARELDAAALQRLEYETALFTAEDLNNVIPGTYRVEDTGRPFPELRSQCGQPPAPQRAFTGRFLELQDTGRTLSVTPTVLAFESQQGAREAFASTMAIIDPCRDYETRGDSFARVSQPPIAPAGDEDMSLFARKIDTQLLVADHFVRRGQFVLEVRFAVDGTSSFTEGHAGQVAEAASRKFVTWADKQLDSD